MKNRYTMEADVTIKVKREIEMEVIDFKCDLPDWNYLESFWSSDNQSISFFKWAYTSPGDQYLSRIIITIGEWAPKANQTNRYYVRVSKGSPMTGLHKTHTFKTTQDLVNKIAEETNKFYEKNDYEAKYPDFVRYGIRPTEMEIEQMTKEERAKYPKVIRQL